MNGEHVITGFAALFKFPLEDPEEREVAQYDSTYVKGRQARLVATGSPSRTRTSTPPPAARGLQQRPRRALLEAVCWRKLENSHSS